MFGSGARRWLVGGAIAMAVAALSGSAPTEDPLAASPVAEAAPLATIGPTARVTEELSGVEFHARVDTGAAVSSIHCGPDDFVIEGGSDDPWQNIDKPARLRLANADGHEAWVDTEIDDYVEVRSANGAEHRYRIRLPLRCRGVRKRTIVNLNDRSRMTYRLLLGRDFLAGKFVVDVSRPCEASPTSVASL